ncbi:MAG: hypothetical protein QMB33_05800 [Opitutales bacterium]
MSITQNAYAYLGIVLATCLPILDKDGVRELLRDLQQTLVGNRSGLLEPLVSA